MRWLKVLLTLVVGVIALLALGITFTIGWRPIIGPKARPLTDRRFEATTARLQRGEYLVRAVANCLHCHSELDPSVEGLPIVAATAGGGRQFIDPGIEFMVSPNITPDTETGGGSWTDDMFARAIREGIGNDGRALFPLMPYVNYRHMSDEDLASVITYIRSLPPVRKTQPRSAIPFPVNRFINAVPQPLEGPVPPPDLSTPEKRGEYLVAMASCSDCHTPMDDKGQYIMSLAFAGGNIFKFEGREPKAAANITPGVNGIPYYTPELFVETIRTGRVRERKLSDLMPWGHYRNMNDDDLRAMFAYLKTVEPIDHFVDNAQPPSRCARCNLLHGGGERNKGG
jgi:mono/diheme cytochrome c family protein